MPKPGSLHCHDIYIAFDLATADDDDDDDRIVTIGSPSDDD
jgi:hypothetical protein